MSRSRLATIFVVLAVLVASRYVGWPPPAAPEAGVGGEAEILSAFERHRSGVWVESAGVVERVLPDDEDGDRHQRFILSLSSGHTLLISHNIDLAPRVERLDRGDKVAFRGQYEWNSQGGVVHWTHRDPDNASQGGWLDHAGRRYR